MMNVQNIIERIRELISDDTLVQLKDELNGYHSADLADIFVELRPDERLECFKLLELEKAADLVEYLSPSCKLNFSVILTKKLPQKLLQNYRTTLLLTFWGIWKMTKAKPILISFRINFQQKCGNF